MAFQLSAFSFSLFALTACGVDRTIAITSEPPGALVYLNDVEVGRTPLETGFTFYGHYDVRLRREGYEPIITSRKLPAPIYEYPPIDLVTLALPVPIRHRVSWHFDLQPSPPLDESGEEALLERAEQMRASVVGAE